MPSNKTVDCSSNSCSGLFFFFPCSFSFFVRLGCRLERFGSACIVSVRFISILIFALPQLCLPKPEGISSANSLSSL
ncbi:MAG: hypothetical protein BYD32DRAFT_404360 [Podila humilis]|nr:MAG: hypothetical protein BYD32DRAFT_404360 [Podila humilis]